MDGSNGPEMGAREPRPPAGERVRPLLRLHLEAPRSVRTATAASVPGPAKAAAVGRGLLSRPPTSRARWVIPVGWPPGVVGPGVLLPGRLQAVPAPSAAGRMAGPSSGRPASSPDQRGGLGVGTGGRSPGRLGGFGIAGGGPEVRLVQTKGRGWRLDCSEYSLKARTRRGKFSDSTRPSQGARPGPLASRRPGRSPGGRVVHVGMDPRVPAEPARDGSVRAEVRRFEQQVELPRPVDLVVDGSQEQQELLVRVPGVRGEEVRIGQEPDGLEQVVADLPGRRRTGCL